MTHEEQARAALRAGDLAQAGRAARQLSAQSETWAAGTFLQGMVAAEQGQVRTAVDALEAVCRRAPCAEYLAQLARLLILLRREEEAGTMARRAFEAGPQDALTFDTIGCVLARLGDHEGSLAPFAAAVGKEPDNADFRFNLAAASGFTGRVADANEHYEAILKLRPGFARAHYALSILSRQTVQDNHIARLETALASVQAPDEELRIRYALAKELEDLGRSQEGFAHLMAANRAHKRATGYAFAQDGAIFDAIETAFAKGGVWPDAQAEVLGNAADGAPIFVVGMPRTGTTLVDRILSSHPEVESVGELQAMPLAVKTTAGTRSRTVIDPATIAASLEVEPALVGQAYRARAQSYRHRALPRYVDKLPANFLYVGHIARALPDARIVCLRRNAMDTVWSNFRNLFAVGSAYYAYSYDLMDIARYYVRFDRLMAQWDRLFPGRVHQLDYETLVHDQEQQTRRLLDHCGLAWDARCLDFHRNAAAVATPSAAQVRRPLNADGIGRWKHHAEQMKDVRALFETAGITLPA